MLLTIFCSQFLKVFVQHIKILRPTTRSLTMNGTMKDDDVAGSPPYGRRLLPVELDRIAKADPGRPHCARPRDPTNLALGFEDISYKRIANAVNRTAHWLQRELGKPSGFETVAYLAAPDLRNVLLTFAVSKVGFQVGVSNHREALMKALSDTNW